MAPRQRTSQPFVAAMIRDPGPTSSDRLRLFLSAFEPCVAAAGAGSSQPPEKGRREDDNHNDDAMKTSESVREFALDALVRAHGEEGGTNLARAYRPAVDRAAAAVSSRNPSSDAAAAAAADSFESSASEPPSAGAVAARLCVYAAMYDSFVKFDGGLVNTYGEGANCDSALQLPEWIYGYRIVLRNAIFEGLKIRTEKQAREAFRDMLGEDDEEGNEVSYDQWCDYLERKEVEGDTEMGVLFDVDVEPSEKDEEETAAAKSSSDANETAAASLAAVAEHTGDGNEASDDTTPLGEGARGSVRQGGSSSERQWQGGSGRSEVPLEEGGRSGRHPSETLSEGEDVPSFELVELNENISASKGRHQDRVVALERRLDEADAAHKKEISELLATLQSERSAAALKAEQRQKYFMEEVESLEQRHQTEVTELKTRLHREEKLSAEEALNTAERNAAAELERLRMQVQTRTEERDATKAEVIGLKERVSAKEREHQIHISDLKERLRKTEESHLEERSELAETLRAERDAAAQELERQRIAHDHAAQIAADRHGAEAEELGRQLESERSAAAAEAERQKKRLTEELESLEQRRRKEVAELGTLLREREASHREEKLRSREALEAAERDAAAEMGRLRARAEKSAQERDAMAAEQKAAEDESERLRARLREAAERRDALGGKLSELNEDIAASADRHRDEVAALERRLDAADAARKKEISELSAALQSERSAAAKEAERQRERTVEKLASAEQRHRTEIAELKTRLEEKESSHRREKLSAEEALDAAERSATEELERLRGQVETSTEERDATKARVIQLEEQASVKEQEHRSQVAELKERLLKMEEAHGEECSKLAEVLQAERDATAKEVEQQRVAHDRAAAEAKRQQERMVEELASLKDRHQKEVAELEMRLQEREDSHREEKLSAEKALETVERNAAVELERLRRQVETSADERDATLKEVTQLKEQVSSKEQEHRSQVAELKERLQKTEEANKQELSKLEEALRAERDAAAKEVERQRVAHKHAVEIAADRHGAEAEDLRRRLSLRGKEVRAIEEALQTSERNAATELDGIRAQLEAKTCENEAAADTMRRCREELAASESKHQSRVAALEEEVRELKEAHKAETSSHTEALRLEREGFTRAMEQQQTAHNEAAALAAKRHRAQVAELRRRLQESGDLRKEEARGVEEAPRAHEQGASEDSERSLRAKPGAAAREPGTAAEELKQLKAERAGCANMQLEEASEEGAASHKNRSLVLDEGSASNKNRSLVLAEAQDGQRKQVWTRKIIAAVLALAVIPLLFFAYRKCAGRPSPTIHVNTIESEECKARSATLSIELDAFRLRSEGLEKQLETTQKKHGERVREAEEAMAKQASEMGERIKESAALAGERDALQSRSEQLEKALEKTRKDGDERVREAEKSMAEQASEMDARIQEGVGTIATLRSDLDATRGELDGLRAEKARNEEENDRQVAALRSQLEASRADFVERLEEGHSRAASLESTLAERNSYVAALRTELEEMQQEKQNTTCCFSSGMSNRASTVGDGHLKVGALFLGAKLSASAGLPYTSTRAAFNSLKEVDGNMRLKLSQAPSHPIERTSKRKGALLRDNIVPMAVGAGAALLLPFLWCTLGGLVAPALAGLPLWAGSLFGRTVEHTAQANMPFRAARTLLGPFLWTAMGHLGIIGQFARTAGIAGFIKAILKW